MRNTAKTLAKAPSRTAEDPRALQALVRATGLRSTSARIAVLGYFHRHGGTNSHAELFTALADQGLDRATVYRVLMDLSEVGILARTDLGDHVWRFELESGLEGAGHEGGHPHFVCVDCGEVSCLPGLSFKLEGAGRAPKSVGSNDVSVQLKGRCDNCA